MKNLTQRLRFALKAFKTGQLIQPMPCEVIDFNDESDPNMRFGESLGITAKRNDELADMITEAHKATKTKSELFRAMSLHCKHPNELAWCCYTMGAFDYTRKSSPLINLLGSIFNPK